MPNWAEGTLKVRGIAQNVCDFFVKGVNVYDKMGDRLCESKKNVHNYSADFFSYLISFGDTAFIEGTTRAFVDDCPMVEISADSGNEKVTIAVPFKQAWDVMGDEFWAISKKYDIDIRVNAYERGTEFSREVIIEKGVKTLDKTTEYDNYTWDCPMPLLGG